MHHTRIDYLACKDSPVHRLDSRTKLIAAIVFTVFVISQGRTAISMIVCYAVWPFALLVVGRVPLKFAFKQILIVSPFVAVLALSSLFYDRTAVDVSFGPLRFGTTMGVLRCVSIIAKFIVTMAALIGLVATTRFSDLLNGMAKLGMPKILVMQLGFLYRYIFLLIDRAEHMLRARAGRKLRNLGVKRELKTASSMVGSLCLSSFDMAGRINTAMQARGFDGEFHTLTEMHLARNDLFYSLALAAFLAALGFLGGVI